AESAESSRDEDEDPDSLFEEGIAGAREMLALGRIEGESLLFPLLHRVGQALLLGFIAVTRSILSELLDSGVALKPNLMSGVPLLYSYSLVDSLPEEIRAVSLIPRGLRSDLQEPERKEGLVLYAADLVMTTQSIAY
ncbi:hypothetical protein SLEP1_g59832, partial [Rubroshorea leprosula]